MSRYTTQVRYIVENTLKLNGKKPEILAHNARCREAAPYIFTFDYPIWNESDRIQFESDVLMKYYMREIALETVPLWKIYLESWLNTNMGYWSQKMNGFLRGKDIESFMKNPNSFTDIYTGTDDTTGSGNGSSEGMNKYYEVPSRDIQVIDDHLNNASQGENSNEYANTGHSSTSHTLTHKTEATPNTIKIWMDYKASIENTYRELLEAMYPLFMGVY